MKMSTYSSLFEEPPPINVNPSAPPFGKQELTLLVNTKHTLANSKVPPLTFLFSYARALDRYFRLANSKEPLKMLHKVTFNQDQQCFII